MNICSIIYHDIHANWTHKQTQHYRNVPLKYKFYSIKVKMEYHTKKQIKNNFKMK